MLVTEVPTFRRFWYPLAFTDDLAGGPLARRLLGEDLVVWATADGASAARDVCPHRSAALSGGWVDDGCIVCPYHGWRFGADGAAIHIPQLDPGLPVPPRARLATVRTAARHGVVWVALDEPLLDVPELPGTDDSSFRWIRQFDEVWVAAATRLMDNSFDPAHVAYVHRGSFGTPDRARIDPPEVQRTAEGMVLRATIEVENHLPEARRVTGSTDDRTVRRIESRLVGPFLRVMTTSYPSGRTHVIVTSATPVDDHHLRLVQWAVRNDAEDDVPAADIVAFDRLVTLEDKALLERVAADYSVEPTAEVHLKVDRATVELRRIYREMVEGTWSPQVRV